MSEPNPEQMPNAELVLTQLAASHAFIPQEHVEGAEAAPEGAIALPVIEQEGTQFVPVFTSAEALTSAGADPETAVEVSVAQLAGAWPSDELWLAVDPSSPDGMTIPPDVIRMLPGLVGAGQNGTA